MRWRKVVGFPRYLVSDCGKVWDTKKLRFITITPRDKKGYRCCWLRDETNVGKVESYHRILAKAFIDNPRGKAEVNHIDGNKSNNQLNNLEWVTRKENADHAWENNLIKIKCVGVKSNFSKFSEETIKGILSYKGTGLLQKDVAKKFNCSRQYVSRLWRGERWTHLHDN